MNLLGTQYNINHLAFEIYLAGCSPPHCEGCHNPESWDFSAGEPLTDDVFLNKIVKPIRSFDKIINNIWVLGGEPLDQKYIEFCNFCVKLKGYFENKYLWLWTKYDLSDIDYSILVYFDYVKCGRYKKNLTSKEEYDIKLASLNQYIVKLI